MSPSWSSSLERLRLMPQLSRWSPRGLPRWFASPSPELLRATQAQQLCGCSERQSSSMKQASWEFADDNSRGRARAEISKDLRRGITSLFFSFDNGSSSRPPPRPLRARGRGSGSPAAAARPPDRLRVRVAGVVVVVVAAASAHGPARQAQARRPLARKASRGPPSEARSRIVVVVVL